MSMVSPGDDAELLTVERWWLTRPQAARRIGDVIRRSFDEVLDGQRTGRFIYEDLRNTEKTYVGTKVELLLADEFNLARGSALDYLIDGVEVDCKYTQDTSWMIPVEAQDKLCLLIRASDATALYSFGLLRCHLQYLNAPNRDLKRSISVAGQGQIRWLWRDEPMPENLLRNLPDADRLAIFADSPKRGGQQRINELFRRVHDRIVRREVVVTVARQDDSMKRVRDARKHLQPQGIIILGHQLAHPGIARDLELPVPRKGEFVATRLVTAKLGRQLTQRPSAVIGGTTWLKAEPGEPEEAGPIAY